MSELPVYKGEVEAVLKSNSDEILQELIGVIEAAQEKSIKLTKSGIPPKPLWSAVNDRLLWRDPKAVLYDWDEVDQIRFIYSIGARLLLVQPDADRQLDVGPGADAFFLSPPTRRSEMLMNAYIDVLTWDERCDARDEQGHRFNFGQTFRRDFLREPDIVRRALIDGLKRAQPDAWTEVSELAVAVSGMDATLLISEDDDAPDTPLGESDIEVERLCEYWVLLAARFGWVDIARTPPHPDSGRGTRLFRVTALATRLFSLTIEDENEESDVLDKTPFVIQANSEVMFYREEGDIGDEYLLRRITSNPEMPGWGDPVAAYRVTPDSLRRALDSGLDISVIEDRLLARSKTDIPNAFRALIDDARRRPGNVVISQGLTAVELGDVDKKLKTQLTKAGFRVFGDIAIVPWRKWSSFTAVLGDEVTEGFRYPPEEPLAAFKKRELELEWPVLPMMSRDFLIAAGAAGDPPKVDLSEKALAKLAQEGWPLAAVAEAVSPLVDDELPSWLRGGKSAPSS